MRNEINLLDHFLLKKRSFFTYRNMGSIFFLSVMILLTLHYNFYYHKRKIQYQNTKLSYELQKIQNDLSIMQNMYPITQYDILQKEITSLEKQYKHNQLTLFKFSGYSGFTPYLYELANEIPDGVWLTQINVDRSKNLIELHGLCLKPSLLETFYAALAKNVVFSKLFLKVDEVDEKKFPITFLITGKRVLF